MGIGYIQTGTKLLKTEDMAEDINDTQEHC
jgi:hypothetical protein